MHTFTRVSPAALALAALSLAVASPRPSAGQALGTVERRCVTAVDKGTAALAKTEALLALGCLKQAAAGKLGAAPTVEACIAADVKGKMAKRRLSVLRLETLHCVPGALPAFGVPYLTAPYDPPTTPELFDPNLDEVYAETTFSAAPAATLLTMHDAFGDPLDAGVLLKATNEAGAACQGHIAKALTHCAAAERKAILSCKKQSLGMGAGTTAALISACLETNGDPASGVPDPKGKIAKACTTAVDAALTKYCTGQVPAALPGALRCRRRCRRMPGRPCRLPRLPGDQHRQQPDARLRPARRRARQQ